MSITPYQKATDLVNSFNGFTDSNSLTSDLNDYEWHLRNMKRCAILSVNEIINVLGETVYYKQGTYNYWIKVKEEIHNL